MPDEPLRRHTTFRIGGPASAWAEPADLDDLRRVAEWSRRAAAPLVLLGEGSNLLVHDDGLDAVAVSLSAAAFRRCALEEGGRLRVGCGLSLGGLLRTTCQWGLSGCEFLSGIPGTVGGSLVMNAGGGRAEACDAPDLAERPIRHIGELVESVLLMTPDGDLRRIGREALTFGYRSSNLHGGILLETVLTLTPADPSVVQDRVQQYFRYKRRTQDLVRPSAGCVFRNPPGDSAGRLIEASGLKGRRVGGASVSPIHANFIINDGGAMAADVLALIEIVQETVAREHGVRLEPELIVIGGRRYGS